MIAIPAFRTVSRRAWVALLCMNLVVSSLGVLSLPANALDMTMRTGYYTGTGTASIPVTGLGFQPDLVMVKAATATTSMVFKTSTMLASNAAYLSATANNTGSNLTLNSDGFTVGTGLAIINTVNVLYRWIAYGNSDCTASGSFCVGTYTGNGAASRAITTGFQPDVVMNKRSTNVAGHFRTTSMPTNTTNYFTSTVQNTTGALIASFSSSGFNVGATDNVSGGVYDYVAFKSGASVAQGTYTGNGADNRSISSLGFSPNVVFVKNSSSTTANNRRAVFSTTHHYGDHASYASDNTADAVNLIQAMEPDGFQVGASGNVNQNGNTIYWFAIGGESPPSASGTYEFAQGSYTGTGASLPISGLGFSPNVVLINDDQANYAVFRTSMMRGDMTAYMAIATAAFTGGVTSLDGDGFTLGTSTISNASGNTYRWQAFGNAYNPMTQSGAADFAIGAYQGNGIDDRNITQIPFQPDLVVARSIGAVLPVWRSSVHSGDTSSYFSATADASNLIQALNVDGFQTGTSTSLNGAAVLQYWFAFKAGPNMQVGSYTGTGINDTYIETTSFRPELLWVKRTTAVAGVSRPSSITTEFSQYFTNAANATNLVKQLNGGGFTLGTGIANTSTGAYRYVVWRDTLPETLTTDIVDITSGIPITSPNVSFAPTQMAFSCAQSSGVLGVGDEAVRISNLRTGAGWTTTIAATGASSAIWDDSSSSESYDFNDPTSSGCDDGGDSDTVAGQMTIEAANGTITPEQFCKTTAVSLGSNQSFSEGVTDTITLATAGVGANTNCYWDISNIPITQQIPLEQLPGEYTIQLTITTVAS